MGFYELIDFARGRDHLYVRRAPGDNKWWKYSTRNYNAGNYL